MNYADGKKFQDTFYAFAKENGYDVKQGKGILPHFDCKNEFKCSVGLRCFTFDENDEFGGKHIFSLYIGVGRRFPPIHDAILRHLLDKVFGEIKSLISHLKELRQGDMLFLDKKADYFLTGFYGPFDYDANMGLRIEFQKHPGEKILREILELIVDTFEKYGSELIHKSKEPEFRNAVRTEVDAILEKNLKNLTSKPNQEK